MTLLRQEGMETDRTPDPIYRCRIHSAISALFMIVLER